MMKRASERSAACVTCGKTFARSDTLLRHEKSHHATEDRGPVHRVIDGTFRACHSCAQARSRCSGGNPCGRCKTRSLECTYPNKRRKGNSGESDSQPTFHATGSQQTLQLDQSKPMPQQQQQSPPKFQEFVFSTDMDTPFAGNQQPIMGRTGSDAEMPMMDQLRMPSHGPASGNPTFSPIPSMSTPATQQRSSAMGNFQNIASLSNPPLGHDQYNAMPMQMGYQDNFNGQATNYDYTPLYDDSMNLNWIPLSIYPSPYGDMDQEFSFLLPSMSDTASLSNDFDTINFDTNLVGMGRPEQSTRMLRPLSDGRLSASISKLVQSPASSHSGQSVATGLSISDVTVLEHKRKRRKVYQMPESFSRPKELSKDFFFPDSFHAPETLDGYECRSEVYDSIAAHFKKLCVGPSRWKAFSSPAFPTHATINACIGLYFEHLQPTFPLLHAPTFSQNAGWLVCLAAAAIGSTFISVSGSAHARDALQEFLRRSILFSADDHDGDFRNTPLAQARILHLISLTNSDRDQLRAKAPRSHADLSRWCLESGILQLTTPDEEVRSDEDIDEAWRRWIELESLRRVGYFIWYLDCALGYMCNARPLCNMDDARAPLPSVEALWDAPSAQAWLMKRNNTPRMPSLCEALETMYNKKTIDPGLSEISHILLIHALYSRTWEVGTHIKQPLSEWKATGAAKGFLNTPSKDNFWLPLYPLYANWRNSACDCLDVLHWQAQAQMATNVGNEHHGFLHLHLARVILLTPFQEIQDLLFFNINHKVGDTSKASFYVHDGSYQSRSPTKIQQIRQITWRWLREDQHKARLAMIHAGSVFWHVRRYSTNSFFEPLAIYLAAIVLWTYGSYKSAALERGAANGTNAHKTSTGPMSSASYAKEYVQGRPGSDQNVQPTRVERAAEHYANSKSRSSRSRSSQTATHNSISPSSHRSHAHNHLNPPIVTSSSPPTSNHRSQPGRSASIATTANMPTSSTHPQPHSRFQPHPQSHNHPSPSIAAAAATVSPNSQFSQPSNPERRRERQHQPHPSSSQRSDSHSHHDPSRSPRSSSNQNDNDSSDSDGDGSGSSSSEDSDAQPHFIHLDRPCDDEIVQHFVRNGHNMAGYMSNVGDVCKTPTKVLLEGAKILRTRLACWGVSREYHDILVRLADGKSGGGSGGGDGGGSGPGR